MANDMLKEYLREYNRNIDEIMKKYGEEDGFVIGGKAWWEYYTSLINQMLDKIKNKELSENDARDFYNLFGFGPKLYGNSFVENGLDNISSLFLFLSNPNISADQKIREVVEEPESPHFCRGVGINFVTLFLTSLFPKIFAQWNTQIDGALKMLGKYPKKVRGERKSTFYLKINDVCLKIMDELNFEHLPRVDNFLYCINKGYIKISKGGLGELEQFVTKSVSEEKKIDSALPISDEEIDSHLKMQYFLVEIGKKKGYDVWVAQNDQNKAYNNQQFSDISLPMIPVFTQPATLAIAKYIDVIWFKKGTSYPVRFFEVEHSTSIYSGLLRLNDIKIDYPIEKATVVIPKDRIKLFESQIERRTFKQSALTDVCDYMIYEDIKKWHDAVTIDSKFR